MVPAPVSLVGLLVSQLKLDLELWSLRTGRSFQAMDLALSRFEALANMDKLLLAFEWEAIVTWVTDELAFAHRTLQPLSLVDPKSAAVFTRKLDAIILSFFPAVCKQQLRIQALAISQGEIVLQRQLGSGGQGSVYLGQWQRHGKVAVKCFRSPSLWRTEVKALALLQSRTSAHILHPYGVLDGSIVFPVMECHLQKLIDDVPTIPEPERLKWSYRFLSILVQAAKGVATMHSHGIPHRDLKPDNILILDAVGICLAKVADMGHAKIGFHSGPNSGGTSHLFYTPPELRQPKGGATGMKPWYSKQSFDCYALGAVVKSCINTGIFECHPRATDHLKSIVEDCCQAAPGGRPSAKDVVARLTEVLKAYFLEIEG
ncbi:hypothetical protein SELMODRAFT_425734 [Selaginella moellendorffii]|uniref:Protein kinase domain-containing protein n=1 Tax=Selaginella moellendorffii TaxID=88036 RepID=D8SU38_SELML|nr:hypothetical protein SELMODRAFT_425734 [Selaginella moellendorffii]